MFLAQQIRALRGDLLQSEFGRLIGKPQSVVSRLEDPDYGKVTLQTLLDIAGKLDIALLVRFVDYPTFVISTEDISPSSLMPASFSQAAMNSLLSVDYGGEKPLSVYGQGHGPLPLGRLEPSARSDWSSRRFGDYTEHQELSPQLGRLGGAGAYEPRPNPLGLGASVN
jgi:hypothetical protein